MATSSVVVVVVVVVAAGTDQTTGQAAGVNGNRPYYTGRRRAVP